LIEVNYDGSKQHENKNNKEINIIQQQQQPTSERNVAFDGDGDTLGVGEHHDLSLRQFPHTHSVQLGTITLT